MRALDVNQTRQHASLLADSFYNRTRYPGKKGPLSKLSTIEIGNEVDGYRTSLDKSRNFTNWNTVNYTFTYAEHVNAIKDILVNPETGAGPVYQVGSFMNGGNVGPWNPLNVFGTGVFDADEELRRITTTWSEHTYTGVWGMGSPPKTGQLMGKGPVRGVLNARMSDVSVAKRAGMEFIFGETNSYAK